MQRLSHFLIAVVVVLTLRAAIADTPPEPPDGPRRTCSLNNRWCVERQVAPAGSGQAESFRVFERRSGAHGTSDWSVSILSLGKFIVDFEALPRSTSHRIWAESFGLDEHDRLVVLTAEGRAFLINPHNGTLIHGAYAH